MIQSYGGRFILNLFSCLTLHCSDMAAEAAERTQRNEENKWERPLSSYGSMKTDSDDDVDVEMGVEVIPACVSLSLGVQPQAAAQENAGLQICRSDSPDTLYTMASQQTKPPGAVVIDTRSPDLNDLSENDEEIMHDVVVASSPESRGALPDETNQSYDNCQSGRFHAEQDLPHVFKSIQSIVDRLTIGERCNFLMLLCQQKAGLTLQQAMEGDSLDIVDRILENFGQDDSLVFTIRALENIKKKTEATELQNQCRRALIRSQLKEYFIRKYKIIREGVVQPGKLRRLDDVYVEPQISVYDYGGVEPLHERSPHPPSPLRGSTGDTFVSVNDLFRLQNSDGGLVRTALTTGIPGIGKTVSVGKFCLDWAEKRSNKDLQFVITLSFRDLWFLRSSGSATQKMSIMEVIVFFYPECKGIKYLEEDDCKFLIIMDSFDCYKAPLDWENTPVIKDNHTRAHTDVLIVNVIRGTVLRGAWVWILGRHAAVSQIPCQYIDVVTEIQGFSDEMKDDYFTKRFHDEELARKIVTHYKRLPMLIALARQPFVCWVVATVFERYYHCRSYGLHPPRLTPFYINVLIYQTNRRLQIYDGKGADDLKWFSEDKQLLLNMGKMAFKMLERKTRVFYEADMKECGLKLTEVAVFSGICTEELLTADTDGRRTFRFIHFSFQEFMAALYVFIVFRCDSQNVLGSSVFAKLFKPKDQIKSTQSLVQCAVERTLWPPLGHYDMFLRFLCGLLSPQCHDKLLCGFFYPHNIPKISGLAEAQRALEKAIETAQGKNGDGVENLKECLREMTQKDA